MINREDAVFEKLKFCPFGLVPGANGASSRGGAKKRRGLQRFLPYRPRTTSLSVLKSSING